MRIPLLLAALAALSSLGCAGTRTETFDLTVKNGTDQPVSLWLVKDGPPYEAQWLAPEQLAMLSREQRPPGPYGFVAIRPQETASIGPVTGEFDPDVHAILRVYQGLHPLEELLAISRGAHDRLDMVLNPGKHAYTIVTQSGRLEAVAGVLPKPSTRP